MATFYVDLVNGNDTNNGTSWALAWKTFTNGPTAARLAAGDEVRFSKTQDPQSIGSCTWTNNSANVTIPASAYKEIHQAVGNTWTITGTNVTGATSANRKLGATAQQFTCGASFTGGKLGYAAISGGGTQDFSGFNTICFWIRVSSIAIDANVFTLRLCSDTLGDTVVNSVQIPALTTLNVFYPISINVGTLGSNIQSVSLHAASDPTGSPQIVLNNIYATNDLTLNGYLGPSLNDCHYPIMNISGTTLVLDASSNAAAAGFAWYGTTGAYTTFCAKAYFGETAVNFNDSGTAILPTKYIGGYNTATNLVDGMTRTACANSSSPSNSQIENFGFNAQPGPITANIALVLKNCHFLNASTAVITNAASGNEIFFLNCVMNGIAAIVNTSTQKLDVFSCKILRVRALTQLPFGIYAGCLFSGTTGFAINAGTTLPASFPFVNCVFSDPSMSSTYFTSGASSRSVVFLSNCTGAPSSGSFSRGVYERWQTAVKQGADIGSRQVEFLATGGSDRGIFNPYDLKIAEIAVTSGTLVTITAWAKKDHATNIACSVFVYEGYLGGVLFTETVKANDTAWQQLTLTFTPTQAGVIPVFFRSWYLAAVSSVYVGSITVSQA